MKESSSANIKILAVDDNQEELFALENLLTLNGYKVLTAPNGRDALKVIEETLPDLVLLDVMMPEMSGYEATEVIKADPILRYIPVVLVTSKDDLEHVTKGFDLGADDYIKKPFRKEELLARINAVLRTRNLYLKLEQTENDNQRLKKQISDRYSFSNIIGKSSSMREIYALIEKIKEAEVPVLITGESGTGKELVANALHYNSPRKNKPFVIQNCSAFNENLLESELFGHVRGAFTGAVRDKKGLFEVADGGSFFLDELGEMSLALQVKLLRVLQDGTFTSVGDTKIKKVDVRVLAATNADLMEMVSKGKFREDLYYRLNVVSIQLPPLRERRVDIPLLISYFLDQICSKKGGKICRISEKALKILTDYDWPGNVRELQNEIERLVLMAGDEPEIGPDIISRNIMNRNQDNSRGRRVEGKLKDAIENLERNMILAALERLGWNKSEAARELGISRSNLIAKVQAYGLEKG
jgi:two-component system, NtrC family, response regulator HupR/HoxA